MFVLILPEVVLANKIKNGHSLIQPCFSYQYKWSDLLIMLAFNKMITSKNLLHINASIINIRLKTYNNITL